MYTTDSAVHVERCDMAELRDVCASMSIFGAYLPVLRGIWHSAGVLADGLVSRQSADAFGRVFAPKAQGAQALHAACREALLQACTLFSSVAGVGAPLGGAGQANYSAANVCLDALSSCRRAHACVSVSVQWGAWAELGMASRGAASLRATAIESASGVRRVGLADGLAALRAVTTCESPASVSVVPVAWERLLLGMAVPAFVSGVVEEAAPALQSVARASVAAAASRGSAASAKKEGVSLPAVLAMVRRTSGSAVDADAPLMEAGVDSLGATEVQPLLSTCTTHSIF